MAHLHRVGTQVWYVLVRLGRAPNLMDAGGICSVSLFGRPMIIINSIDVLEEFDKKSAIYSERPRLEMGGELVGYSETLVLMRYGPRFRHYRKQFARYIGNGVIEERHPLVVEYTRTFLKRALKEPESLMAHLRK